MTRAERRQLMPVSSAIWDDWLAEGIQPAWFRAVENNHSVEHPKREERCQTASQPT